MSIVSPIEKKAWQVISGLPEDFSVQQFADEFKKQYPSAWASIARDYSYKSKVGVTDHARPAEMTIYLIRLIRTSTHNASHAASTKDMAASPGRGAVEDEVVKLSSRLRAKFRERARGILTKDRVNRRAGKTINTTAEITVAQEQAYRLGFWDGAHGTQEGTVDADGTLTWIEIPPRPRKAFESLCLASWPAPRTMSAYEVPQSCAIYRKGHGKWFMSHVPPGVPMKGVGDQSIKTLIRLRLLNTDDSRHVSYAFVSPTGWACWQKFLHENPEYQTQP